MFPKIRNLFKPENEQEKDNMISETIPGIYENGIVKPSRKLDITGKRDVLIIFKEKRKESIVNSITRKIKPIEKEVIDEAIELTELVRGLNRLSDIPGDSLVFIDSNISLFRVDFTKPPLTSLSLVKHLTGEVAVEKIAHNLSMDAWNVREFVQT
ncbi:MAG: hypothetical protein AYK18_11760 [Theionarchaea archaeon DG-70]|nr:MAG: hypothetical protein AYK18_11760 [Theionarchaea archaeon DG-70]